MAGKFTVLDLFSGIGGISLGLERTGGFETVAFCERDEYAHTILRKHWPDVPIYGDVRGLGATSLGAQGISSINLVCGGFPCQDISLAGRGEGLGGARSGLWFEMLRIIDETRPSWVIAENVSALRSRGLDTVLRGLASVGYDAEWHCIPASAVGAPHRRDRIWIVAHAEHQRRDAIGIFGHGQAQRPLVARQAGPALRSGENVADTARFGGPELRSYSNRINPPQGGEGPSEALGSSSRIGEDTRADSDSAGLERRNPPILPKCASEWIARARSAYGVGSGWLSEPDVGRVADGIPARVDRLRCLGNSVVPQIPEIIGRAILNHAFS